MAFDFKKEYKEFYMPKKKPEIVTVPKANYIAVAVNVRGSLMMTRELVNHNKGNGRTNC